MKRHNSIYPLFILAGFLCFTVLNCSCGNIHYGFRDKSTIPDSIKTVTIHQIENRAQYQNTQLTQKLSDKIRQKIIGQTKLTQTNSDNPDWEISGTITQYSFSTSAISGQQVATNRLTVTVHIIKISNKEDNKDEYDVSRNFEFRGTQSIQQAEATLMDEMVRTLTDEIFNKLFADW
ncbi:MAG: LptE family protein [Bacteroidota bacterium]